MKGVFKAAKKGDAKEIASLVKKGANLNEVDAGRRTPLFYACEDGHLECVRVLLYQGAKVNVSDGKGVTPLEVALDNKHENLAVYLVQEGADLDELLDRFSSLSKPINKRLELQMKEAKQKSKGMTPKPAAAPAAPSRPTSELQVPYIPVSVEPEPARYRDSSQPSFNFGMGKSSGPEFGSSNDDPRFSSYGNMSPGSARSSAAVTSPPVQRGSPAQSRPQNAPTKYSYNTIDVESVMEELGSQYPQPTYKPAASKPSSQYSSMTINDEDVDSLLSELSVKPRTVATSNASQAGRPAAAPAAAQPQQRASPFQMQVTAPAPAQPKGKTINEANSAEDIMAALLDGPSATPKRAATPAQQKAAPVSMAPAPPNALQDAQRMPHFRLSIVTTSPHLELGVVISLVSQVVVETLHETFNNVRIQILADAAKLMNDYFVPPDDKTLVVAQNVKEITPTVVEARRAKRMFDDYKYGIQERVRPLLDALRVLFLDRRAEPARLIHPPALLLIGGVYSIFLSAEQTHQRPLEEVVANMAKVIRQCAANETNSIDVKRNAILDFIKFFRVMGMRMFQTRNGTLNKELSDLVTTMGQGFRALMSQGDRTTLLQTAKIMADSLKTLLVSVKPPPIRVGPEINDTIQDELLVHASEMFGGVIMFFRDSRLATFNVSYKNFILRLLEVIQQEVTTLMGIVHGLPNTGNAVLRSALAISSAVIELSAKYIIVANSQKELALRDQMLRAADVAIHHANIIEIVTACRAVKNRIVHKSHIAIGLRGLAFALGLMLDPVYF